MQNGRRGVTVNRAITCLDQILDDGVGASYKDAPLAQDWARISKIAEELGEAVQVFIGITGQNPRKGVHGTSEELKKELLDTSATALLALQHFFKGEDVWKMLENHMIYLHDRMCDA